MKTTYPKFVIKNNELFIDGNFNFHFSETFVTEDLIPVKNIKFDWCIEMAQDVKQIHNEDHICEIFGEKLKQDFIKQMKSKGI